MWYSSKYRTEDEAENAYAVSRRGKLETMFQKRGEIARKINDFSRKVYGAACLAVRRFSGSELPTELPF